jgi:hypothetical protein
MLNKVSFQGHETILRKTSSIVDSGILKQISKINSEQIEVRDVTGFYVNPGTIKYDAFSPNTSIKINTNKNLYEPKNRIIELINNSKDKGLVTFAIYEDFLSDNVALRLFKEAFGHLHNLFCNK